MGTRKIRFWDKWYVDHKTMDDEVQVITEVLAWKGFAVYVIAAGVRYVAACKLRIHLIWHCAIASTVSLLFLFFLGLAASHEKEGFWKAEPIAAIVLSLI